MLYKNDNAGDRIAVPERFFQYMGSVAKEGHSLYRCLHCRKGQLQKPLSCCDKSLDKARLMTSLIFQSIKQSINTYHSHLITCIDFEGRHLKCMPNICIQF